MFATLAAAALPCVPADMAPMFGALSDPSRNLDARVLHRVITASVRELIETARLQAQAGPVDEVQLERLIFRAAAPIVPRRKRDDKISRGCSRGRGGP